MDQPAPESWWKRLSTSMQVMLVTSGVISVIAAIALGVSGTPTFFLEGKQLELRGPNDLPEALDRALTK